MTTDIDSLAVTVVYAMQGRTVATAESITGGGLGYAITSIPGSSDIYVGGSIAYHSQVKQSHLGVSTELIAAKTVYSEEVAFEMARGALAKFNTTWAIATTGVAGPNPLDGYPVGVVWVAIEGPISHTIELALSGDRESVRNAATSSAIATFARILRHRS